MKKTLHTVKNVVAQLSGLGAAMVANRLIGPRLPMAANPIVGTLLWLGQFGIAMWISSRVVKEVETCLDDVFNLSPEDLRVTPLPIN